MQMYDACTHAKYTLHAHAHTHKHTHKHTHTHTHTHARARTQTQSHTVIRTRAHSHSHTLPHVRNTIPTCAYLCVCVCVCLCAYVYVSVRFCVCVNAGRNCIKKLDGLDDVANTLQSSPPLLSLPCFLLPCCLPAACPQMTCVISSSLHLPPLQCNKNNTSTQAIVVFVQLDR